MYQQFKSVHRFMGQSGKQNFFTLTSVERKEKGFDFRMDERVYSEMNTMLKADHSIHPTNLADTGAAGGVHMVGPSGSRNKSVASEGCGDGQDDDQGSTRDSTFSGGSADGGGKRRNVRQYTFDEIADVMDKHGKLMTTVVDSAIKRQCSILTRQCDILEREVEVQKKHYEKTDQENLMMCNALLEIAKAILTSISHSSPRLRQQDTPADHVSKPHQQATSASHVSKPRQQATSASHVSKPRQRTEQEYHVSRPPAWYMLLRSQTAVMDQRLGEADEAYLARMMAWSTETKKRADDAAAAAKKKAEDAEQARLLALKQQREHDEAATRAADEERNQRREKIFSGGQTLLTMAAEWRTKAENGKLEDCENKIALLLSHLTDLLATCITQQEDIHNLDNSLAKLQSRLQQLEQRPVAAPDASASTTSDRLEALEMHVASIQDGAQLQQTATQQLQQRICTTANTSSSEPRETTPKFDGQEIFCDSIKTDPIPWFRKFELTLQLHNVKEHKHHSYLYSRLEGVCQAWLDNLLSKYGVLAADLHTKISWDDLKAAWHKRFQVEPPEIKAMDKLMVFEQGTLPSTDWIAEYQRLTSVPNIQMDFKAIRHYFISRSCLTLSNALTHGEDTLTTMAELFDKAAQIIITNKEAKNLRSFAAGPSRD
ncbi:hypothetical protein CBR_g37193 [Chara braunii]|uniref:Retrotransposon gag domain-containing protein n=1 Tax=Chara braunii TaxID=69332 RepID=A0A388LMI0_CHABU|nr:hypothetical protein CBR_g37193 [Chara braunii]|eukprot:GBG83481.1 hypothetical protein CBR_g37193 [Chara braunii]